jgi:heat shock protein HtpX
MKVLRTTFLLTALTLVLLTIGGAVGGRNGMTIALIFAAFSNAFAYFFSTKSRCGRVAQNRCRARNCRGFMK